MILRARVCLLPLALLPAAGCDDASFAPAGERDVVPWLTASPSAGQAPHLVTLDATDSVGDGLEFRWDHDGDGQYETDYAADPQSQWVYGTPGTFRPAVEIRARSGRVVRGEADVEVQVLGPAIGAARTIDLDVDTDRDGALTGLDEPDEDAFSAVRGAAVLANVDDDDEDGERDARDDRFPGEEDDDLAVGKLHRLRALESGDQVVVDVSPPAARARVRVFGEIDGAWKVLVAPDDEATKISPVVATTADIPLRVEALTGRSSEFDGRIRITASLLDRDGDTISTDVVSVVVPPVIFQDNLQPAETLYVMNIQGGWDSNAALLDALDDHLDDSVVRYDLGDWDYGYDRWVQDNMELGYQAIPTSTGVQTMRAAMQAERNRGGGLEGFVPFEKLGPDEGFFYPGGPETSHNYGGNLEVAPPHTVDGVERPFGRLLYGGGTSTLLGVPNHDTMNDEQLDWLNGQGVQGPAIEISSEWLAVGHIDEIVQFVPHRGATAQKPFVAVIASPQLARDILLELRALGHGATSVFAGRETETTVDAILDDEDLMAFNEAADARILDIRDTLKREIGLADADFRAVPVLYENIGDQGYDMAVALNPGIQNLITTGDRLFVPDPEGPVVDGVDAWREATISTMQDTTLDLVFVDVFESYHLLLGEAHCGTNVDRAPYARAWWSEQ